MVTPSWESIAIAEEPFPVRDLKVNVLRGKPSMLAQDYPDLYEEVRCIYSNIHFVD